MVQARRKKRFLALGKKPLLVVAALLLLILAAWAVDRANIIDLPFFSNPSDTIDAADSGPTPEEKQAEAEVNADKKQALIDEGIAPEVTDEVPASTNPSIDLSARQENNGTVTIFTKLYGYSSGNCALTVTNGGQSHSQSATVIYQPEYSTCAGFSVPISQLGSGAWNITLKATDNGASATKTISYEVD